MRLELNEPDGASVQDLISSFVAVVHHSRFKCALLNRCDVPFNF